MWTRNDDFWLSLPEHTKSGLMVALGELPLRITASDAESDIKRKGHIDVKIVTFDRSQNMVLVSVVENTTGLRFSSRLIALWLDEHMETEICKIRKIEGINF